MVRGWVNLPNFSILLTYLEGNTYVNFWTGWSRKNSSFRTRGNRDPTDKDPRQICKQKDNESGQWWKLSIHFPLATPGEWATLPNLMGTIYRLPLYTSEEIAARGRNFDTYLGIFVGDIYRKWRDIRSMPLDMYESQPFLHTNKRKINCKVGWARQ